MLRMLICAQMMALHMAEHQARRRQEEEYRLVRKMTLITHARIIKQRAARAAIDKEFNVIGHNSSQAAKAS